jgi:hypothetical protein
MTTNSQRITSAFAVLCSRNGDVTALAYDCERSPQSLNREAERGVEAR